MTYTLPVRQTYTQKIHLKYIQIDIQTFPLMYVYKQKQNHRSLDSSVERVFPCVLYKTNTNTYLKKIRVLFFSGVSIWKISFDILIDNHDFIKKNKSSSGANILYDLDGLKLHHNLVVVYT